MRILGVTAYRSSVALACVVVPDGAPGRRTAPDGTLTTGSSTRCSPWHRPEQHPTLYHWDLPQALQDRGGRAARYMLEHFAAYADRVAGALGDRVSDWAMLNEPRVSAWLGHPQGVHAWGITDLRAAVDASLPPAARPRPGHPGYQGGGHPPPGSLPSANALTACAAWGQFRRRRRSRGRGYDGHANRWWIVPAVRPGLSCAHVWLLLGGPAGGTRATWRDHRRPVWTGSA